jgi:magnesium-transporting ATPase (P-type)
MRNVVFFCPRRWSDVYRRLFFSPPLNPFKRGSILTNVFISNRAMDSVAIDIGGERNVDWHSMSAEDVLCRLGCKAESGLGDHELTERREKYGRNELTPPKKLGFFMRLFLQINNILIYILFAAAIISGVLEEWAEVGLIIGVVVLNVTIGMIQEGKAEKATDAIKSMLSPKAIVIRNGIQQEIAGVNDVICSVFFLMSF